MSDRLASYNGYQFNSYSDIRVSANAVMDDAGRTVLYHQYKIRIESVIYAQDEDNAGEAGEHFRRIRSKLLKQGQELRIYHKGFDTDGLFVVNANGSNDVKFGPKPSVVTWEPVGYENAVHVVWECEANVTGCLQSKRSTGLMALNYSMTTKVNQSGYTTRTTSGYLEIAMTRNGRNIPDTADAYRDEIKIPKPPNYQRETTWNLSLDKLEPTSPSLTQKLKARMLSRLAWSKSQATIF